MTLHLPVTPASVGGRPLGPVRARLGSHPRSISRWITRNLLLGLLIIVIVGAAPNSLMAASGTWNGTTDANWATPTNWGGLNVPGTGDTATFNNGGSGRTTLSLGILGV